MFFFLQNSSLLFSITRSCSFSVINVSANIKNNVEKDTTLLLFFLSKSRGGHAISFQMEPWVPFGLPYLLIELFYIGMPVVRTDGRAGGRSLYGHVITKFSRWIVYHIFLTMVLRCARLVRESSAIICAFLKLKRKKRITQISLLSEIRVAVLFPFCLKNGLMRELSSRLGPWKLNNTIISKKKLINGEGRKHDW